MNERRTVVATTTRTRPSRDKSFSGVLDRGSILSGSLRALPVNLAVCAALPAPHLNANRRAEEAETLPQLIDRKRLEGEVERVAAVGEDHDGRRRIADLRR